MFTSSVQYINQVQFIKLFTHKSSLWFQFKHIIQVHVKTLMLYVIKASYIQICILGINKEMGFKQKFKIFYISLSIFYLVIMINIYKL